MKRKKKFRIGRIVFVLFIFSLLICIGYLLTNYKPEEKSETKMVDLTNMNIEDIKEYAKEHELKLEIIEKYDYDLPKDKIINQSILENEVINAGDKLIITISLGPIPMSVYEDNKVNELGGIPVMMYHGIVNIPSFQTENTGGNVDKDGYNRTAEAFRADLEMYYTKGYRMIRLIDYMNGKIDTELGKTPIVLTFDDGNVNNINVLGLDDKGNIKIDPNSAVGILESFKQKYPNFNVTATFFVNNGLFNQPEYNEKIMKWLVDNGYDIGNHTKSHVNFSNCNSNTAQIEVGYMYKLFDTIIPNKYVNIVALPFGSPGTKKHANFPLILSGIYDDYTYQTEGTLRVGWTYNESPFHKDFDKTFIKRIRAWDNNGTEDIEMVFKYLEKNRYISDGDKDTIVVTSKTNLYEDIKDIRIIEY